MRIRNLGKACGYGLPRAQAAVRSRLEVAAHRWIGGADRGQREHTPYQRLSSVVPVEVVGFGELCVHVAISDARRERQLCAVNAQDNVVDPRHISESQVAHVACDESARGRGVLSDERLRQRPHSRQLSHVHGETDGPARGGLTDAAR